MKVGRCPDDLGPIKRVVAIVDSNRGNARHLLGNPIFFKRADYKAFAGIIVESPGKFPVDLIAYQWMNNHWQIILSTRKDGGMSALAGWGTLTRAQPLTLIMVLLALVMTCS